MQSNPLMKQFFQDNEQKSKSKSKYSALDKSLNGMYDENYLELLVPYLMQRVHNLLNNSKKELSLESSISGSKESEVFLTVDYKPINQRKEEKNKKKQKDEKTLFEEE